MNISQKEKKQVQKKDILKNSSSRSLFNKGIKYLAIALPLLFISPILITVGFKAITKDNNYFLLIFGCILAIFTIVLVTQAFRIILKALFSK
jgi:hypothetical protein